MIIATQHKSHKLTLQNMNIQSKYLDDVCLLRILLILILVLYHSFAIHNGAWEIPVGYQTIPVYGLIADFSYSFFLEAFTFISGLLLGYSVLKKGDESINFKNCFIKKAKRLLLPCIFFSIIYYILFYDLSRPITEIIYTILCGTGHLWFLPMLFWCFVAVYIIEKIHLPNKIAFALAIIATICSFVPLPLRLTNTMHYFLFFYTGYYIMRNQIDLKQFISIRAITILAVVFVAFFIISLQIDKIWGA